MDKTKDLDAGERSAPPPCSVPVLDACCGSRMFWFDRQDTRAIFADKRRETHELTDKSSRGGSRTLTVNPDVLADFTALPWPDDSFAMVVFDPPHLLHAGTKGWQAKKYGKLPEDWQTMIRRGFEECFRVLRPEGTLIFKWNEHEIPVSKILALTPERPLVGQRCGKTARTHWIVFMKPNAELRRGCKPSPPTPCSATKHEAMYRDGWKNCWHCGVELVHSFSPPNASNDASAVSR